MEQTAGFFQRLGLEVPNSTIALRRATALFAYASGDAFGLAYEFEKKVSAPVPKIMLAKDQWPAGGVSDDTLLSLMTLSSLSAGTSSAAASQFVEDLRSKKDSLRGLGPTTRTVLGLPVEEREHNRIGYSNGGIMRTALLGVALTEESFTVRNDWVRALCAITHEKPDALETAQVMAEIFAQATKFPDVSFDVILDKVRNEFSFPINHWIQSKISDDGVSLDPVETFSAVIEIIRNSESVWESYERAICFGGDTDTVAALSGAFTALKFPESFYELDFVSDVDWGEIPNWRDFVQVITKGLEIK